MLASLISVENFYTDLICMYISFVNAYYIYQSTATNFLRIIISKKKNCLATNMYVNNQRFQLLQIFAISNEIDQAYTTIPHLPTTMMVKSKPFFAYFRLIWCGKVAKPTSEACLEECIMRYILF